MIKLSNILLNKENTFNAFYLSCFLLVVGLFFSRALLSISAFLIFVFGTYYGFSKPKIKNQKDGKALLFVAIYLVFLISYFWTTNYNTWLSLSFKNVVFVLIPLGFYFFGDIHIKYTHKFIKLFCLISIVSAIINAFYSLIHYNEVSRLAAVSKHFNPLIGSNYHDLSLIYSLTIVFLVFQLKDYLLSKRLFKIYLSYYVVFSICIVVLAYRLSLITLIICSCYLFANYFYNVKSIKTKTVSIIFMVVILLGGYFSIDPLKNRVNNTYRDLKSIYLNKNPNFQSLAQRLAAIKCASEVSKNNFWIGVAPADLKEEMTLQYDINSYLLIKENRMFIHNQYFYYIASYGIIWITIFILGIIFVAIKYASQNNYLALSVLGIFLSHMLFENTLEMQIPSYMFLFFLLSLKSNINFK